MSPIALGLLITAAALHAGWNLLVKQAGEKQIFTWWAMVAGVACFAPLLALSPLPLARIWPYAVVSALVEALYFVALTRAYKIGDFSLVYPLARGAAPALLAVWATLFLGERPRLAGVIGLVVLLGGLIVVGGGGWWARRAAGGPSARGIGTALGVACCISVYSAIDGAAVRLADPAPYTVLVIALSAVCTAPAVLARYGRAAVVAEWRANWGRIAAVGILTMISYMLVLRAYASTGVSYAGAIREISVVFAALVGWRWLGEGFGAARTIGAGVIFAGILIIAVAG